MGEAKLYGKSGGGMKIDGIIADYYAYAGQNISAGDFVEFINGIASQTTETSSDTAISTTAYTGRTISAVQIDESRVFIAHSYGSSYHLYGIICTISGATITYGTNTQLSSTSYTGYAISAVKLEENKVFIAHSESSNYYLNGMVCTISGTTITAGTDKALVGNGSAGYVVSAVALDSSKVFIAHCYGSSYHLYYSLVTISGTTVSLSADSSIRGQTNAGNAMSATLLPNGNVFIAHSYSSTNYLCGVVCTISGTTVTVGSDTTLISTNNNGTLMSTVALDNGNVFIAHSNSGKLHAIVCSISGTTITAGTDTQLSSLTYSVNGLSVAKLKNGKLFISHIDDLTNHNLLGMIVSVDDKTITHGVDTELNTGEWAGYTTSSVFINGIIFTAHNLGKSNKNLYAQLFGIDETNNVPTNQIITAKYETQVRKATSQIINGVAKTSGTGGTSTAHGETLSVYVPYVNLVKNGDFSDGTNGWSVYGSSGTMEVVNDGDSKALKVTVTASTTSLQVMQSIDYITTENKDHIFYWSGWIKGSSSNVDAWGTNLIGLCDSISSGASEISPEYVFVSGRKSLTSSSTGNQQWQKIHLLSRGEGAVGNVNYFKNIKCYDLTAMFGAGNEPDKAWCDANL